MVSTVKPIVGTDFTFPGQTGVYHGKVRDVYTIEDKYLVAVASDRISAFDVILPKPIPYKGQVLNQIADYFLSQVKDIVPTWFISSPDPNVTIGYRCEPVKVEVVIRSVLTGHAWREYSEGKRTLCGVTMPEGLDEFDMFPEPIITPSTKAAEGHDEDISREDIIAREIVPKDIYEEIEQIALKLFAFGQKSADDKGLILADTKYEFGLLDGKVTLIDEIHTPDSSRYFYKDSYQAFINDRNSERPKHLSKEFLRDWLLANDFSGQEGQKVPEMSDDFVNQISERYIELFEAVTGKKFVPSADPNPIDRIKTNVIKELEGLKNA
ncbi:phosphoribosylaminoimidazolesuccinocarboxamide synthase [Candidatus Saccharibacteria bacterium]|nr:phosphoribosylaminoimidazolesuccinocarboxamide synthase [Candidatus Saccharibacteria bacterium]